MVNRWHICVTEQFYNYVKMKGPNKLIETETEYQWEFSRWIWQIIKVNQICTGIEFGLIKCCSFCFHVGFRLKEPFTLRKRGQREAAIKKVKKRSFALWQKMNRQNEKNIRDDNWKLFSDRISGKFFVSLPFY